MIVRELQPWKCSHSEVVAKVHEVIDVTRTACWNPDRPEREWSRYDVEEANKQLDRVVRLYQRIITLKGTLPPTLSVLGLDGQIVDEASKLSGEVAELSLRTENFANRCKKLILQARKTYSGVDNYKFKKRTALVAFSLITDASTKRPTAGNRNSSFCLIASWILEAAIGYHDPNMEYACRFALQRKRSVGENLQPKNAVSFLLTALPNRITPLAVHTRPVLARNGGFMDPIKQFDDLPDDAVVPRHVTAALLHMSERTVRRIVPTVKLSPRRRGNRVGTIRAIARSDSPLNGA